MPVAEQALPTPCDLSLLPTLHPAGLSHPGNRADQLENGGFWELGRHCHLFPVRGLGIQEDSSPSPSSPQATIPSPGRLSSSRRTMSCCVPTGPGLRCFSSKTATWPRSRPTP